MAATVNFSCQFPWQNMNYKSRARLTADSLPLKRSYRGEEKKSKIQQQGTSMRRNEDKDQIKNRGFLIVASATDRDFSLGPLSASHAIIQFYSSINDKDLKELQGCISEECYIEECSFPRAFHGRKEATHFFDQLIRSMGQNVKFSIERVCEGDDFTAAVNWHLEWKGIRIPFTRGCSFYECSEEGQRLVIKQARVLIESPIKPGGLVLSLLKTVTSIFDESPKLTEGFLESPMLQLFLKIYTMLLAPLINQLLAGYLKIWDFLVQLVALALRILIQISKIFTK